MNVTRFFRDVLPGRSKRRSRRSRKPFQNPLAEIKLPSFRNPFANLPFKVDDAQRFFLILNWLGYVLLFASVVDYALIIYPPQLTDPNWELETFSRMVDHAWILLLSLILIFLPTRTNIRRLEISFLSFLRWMVLLGGVIFILLLPLGLLNTQRINQETVEELSIEQQNRQQQLSNLQEAINTQNVSEEDLQQLGQALGIDQPAQTEDLRGAINEEIDQQQEQLRQQVEIERGERFEELIRRTVRTHIGGLLIGVFLLRLWWEAKWVKSVKNSAPKK